MAIITDVRNAIKHIPTSTTDIFSGWVHHLVLDLGFFVLALFLKLKFSLGFPRFPWLQLDSTAIILLVHAPCSCSQFQDVYWNVERFLQVNVSDHTGEHWLTCFQDAAQKLLERSASEMGELQETVQCRLNDPARAHSYTSTELIRDDSHLRISKRSSLY
jgi:hypothetical protein